SYLEQTLRSVIGQDHPSIEYIVIDGGSTDGSVDMIKRYEDKLAYWVSEKDSGQAEAINKGLARANGDIVAWINSDDFYFPGAIASAVKAFETHPEAGMVYGDTVAVDENGEAIHFPNYAQWDLKNLLTFNIIGQPAVFMRRDVLLKAGFLDPSFHFLLDHQLWIRMAAHAPMVYFPERLAAGRFHESAKNVAQAEKFGEEAFRILDWAETHPLVSGSLDGIRHKSRAAALRINGRYLLDAGNSWEAFKSYVRSLLAHPLTALVEWKRIIFSFLSLFGLGFLQKQYNNWRKSQAQRHALSDSDGQGYNP
ncbi:MAG TPA: glycosyltransferase family 2 protein, partial [Anaerolineales bacterium]|nr:glycosyltransferase family 2 protein [Anaerolineales bacterium]